MNSFNTEKSTKSYILEKYGKTPPVTVYHFNQHQICRIHSTTFDPIPLVNDKEGWYPPGHGDIYRSLYESPFFSNLVSSGKQFAFLSNIDNLGAQIHPLILKFLDSSQARFLMEVTKKTIADIKGGLPVLYGDSIRLLEGAQVPPDKMNEFTSISKFSHFNTNNLWFRLDTLSELMKKNPISGVKMDIIINRKKLQDGTPVIQLEQAAGSAIQSFGKAKVVMVPRDRFLPVKTTSDLFLIQSNVFSESNGTLCVNPKRTLPIRPHVRLGESFKKVQMYTHRFPDSHGFPLLPDCTQLVQLVVSGNVTFGKNLTFSGIVIICAPQGLDLSIPDNFTANDSVITCDTSGNLVCRPL